MATGGHGLPKVSLRPAMPYPSYGRFRGGPPAELMACGHLLLLWTPHAIHLWQFLAIEA